jgi:KipI family sensor histidine kinase inhibitor
MNNTFSRILHAGENCLVVEFGNAIDLEINACVQALRRKIDSQPFRGFVETVPTYRSLSVHFDPLKAPRDLEKLLLRLSEDLGNSEETRTPREKLVMIPACYEKNFAPDIEKVALHAGISVEEVIRRHSARDCYCYMLGFVPGFSYLGGMDPALETPRLGKPRTKIPAGSVAIGDKQTGIYPIDSPGGWHLIGRTPLRLFDPGRTPAIFLEAGMWVRFVPISVTEFEHQTSLAARPGWKPDVRDRKTTIQEGAG